MEHGSNDNAMGFSLRRLRAALFGTIYRQTNNFQVVAERQERYLEKTDAPWQSLENMASLLGGSPSRSVDLEANGGISPVVSNLSEKSNGSTLVESERDEEKKEKKSRINARVISDAIIGLSDGLTVPFALTAGLSAIGDTRIVIYGGFAELIAGAISMGLGGYLGAKSEEESYKATLSSTTAEATTSTSLAAEKIASTLSGYNLPDRLIQELTSHLISSSTSPLSPPPSPSTSPSSPSHDNHNSALARLHLRKRSKPTPFIPPLVSFLMTFHHHQPTPVPSRPFTCAFTIALGYFLGGFIPLLPYLFVNRHEVNRALFASIGIMVFALFIFGYCKTAVVLVTDEDQDAAASSPSSASSDEEQNSTAPSAVVRKKRKQKSKKRRWISRPIMWEGFKAGVQMVLIGGVAAGSAMGIVKGFNSFL